MTPKPTIINTAQSTTYPRLSVQVSLTGLSFLLEVSPNENSFWEDNFKQKLHPGELLIRLIACYKNHPELAAHTGPVRVIYRHKEFALVPQALFDPNQLASYLQYNTKLLTNDYLDYDLIASQEIANVYIPYTNVNNYFFETHGDFTFLHANTVLIQATKPLANKQTKAYIFANIQEDLLDVVVYSSGELKLCNSFAITGPEDFAYFLLFVVEQLNLDPESLQLIFTNGVKQNDSYFELAYRYIRNVQVLEVNNAQVPFLLQKVYSACE